MYYIISNPIEILLNTKSVKTGYTIDKLEILLKYTNRILITPISFIYIRMNRPSSLGVFHNKSLTT